MCAIFGGVVSLGTASAPISSARLQSIAEKSRERGRDGFGWADASGADYENSKFLFRAIIGNCRAEPTTEYVEVKQKRDQQPYTYGDWTIVHNGTIANDADLRTGVLETTIDSAAIVEHLATLSAKISNVDVVFTTMVRDLKGSFAILALNRHHPHRIWTACNYRPLWFSRHLDGGSYFASAERFLPGQPVMLEPYTMQVFSEGKFKFLGSLRSNPKKRALVVCSGGMDSTVAASIAIEQGYEISLLHYRYGSRAEGPEVKAVNAIAERLNVPVYFMDMPIYDPADSPLLQSDSTIAGGEAGAEFAHEWVPARNLVMLSITAALAEAKGFEFIVLGNNLEEAGAYPDNEPEFIERFNAMLPFAVGDGKNLRVLMPVGNMMKHEIVAEGIRLNSPLDLTWSCYRAGDVHCGSCGPCYMRRKAFAINKQPEVIQYKEESL